MYLIFFALIVILHGISEGVTENMEIGIKPDKQNSPTFNGKSAMDST